MQIHWFPGHMTKALRLMQDNLKMIDIIGYVLDARAPFSCINPEFDNLLEHKPCVIILNKIDLADPVKVAKWKNYFESKGQMVVTISSINISQRKAIVTAFNTLAKPMVDKYKRKGVIKSIRAMIIGVPNSGKSTLINCISTRKSAITGDRPGVTKGKQWVRLDSGIELLDTPGTLWPKFTDESVARNLAFIGSIKDDIIDIFEVCTLFIDEIKQMYPQALVDRYGIIDTNKPTLEIIDDICRKRGYIVAGGELDIERCAKAVLDDFRKGKLGNITLEEPKC